MPTPRRILDAIRRLAGSVLSLALLGPLASGVDAGDAGSPANFSRCGKYRYSFEYYRRKGAFGRRGERLSPNDPRGHMSGGHGAGHL